MNLKIWIGIAECHAACRHHDRAGGACQHICHRCCSACLEPTLIGHVFARNELDEHRALAKGLAVPCPSTVQIVADHTVGDVSHAGIAVRGVGTVGVAGFEAFARRQVHVVWICHLRAVNIEIIFVIVKRMLFKLDAPHAVAVTLHLEWALIKLGAQLNLLGRWGFEAEHHTLSLVFGRDDRLRKHPCHHAGSELRLVARGCWGWGAFGHQWLACVWIEQQTQSLVKEIFSIHPGVPKLVMRKFLHIADSFLV